MKKNKFIFLYLLISLCFGYFMISGFLEKHETVKKYDSLVIQHAKIKGQVFREERNIGGAEVLYKPPVGDSDGSPTLFPMPESKKSKVTSPEGMREGIFIKGLSLHKGIDLSGVYKCEILSAASGIVVEVWPAPDGYFRGHDIYGGMIMIKHPSGETTLYAHLSKTFVKEGQRVRRGQVIGRMGNTGKSDGAHLHYEIIDSEGNQLNPLEFIKGIHVEYNGAIRFL